MTEPLSKLTLQAVTVTVAAIIVAFWPKVKSPLMLTRIEQLLMAQLKTTPGSTSRLPFPSMYTSSVKFKLESSLQTVLRSPIPRRSSSHDSVGGCGGGAGRSGAGGT
uniref:Uncharacterized protein LOC105637809 n=1 Tax=Rhizophora mucronata TaxID=61149 RepID=A0A2P2Q5L0_RHIMU